MSGTYLQIGTLKELKLNYCYLCGRKLGSTISPDHIVPTHLFEVGDPHRPKLLVHQKCNAQKSLDDQFFVKMLELNCGFHTDAEQHFSSFMDKAISQKPDAYIVGKRPRDYVLAREIFDNAYWGLELDSGGKRIHQLKLSKEKNDRFYRYLTKMCKGLFVKNAQGATPSKTQVFVRQYVDLDLKGGREKFLGVITNLFNSSKNGMFGQRWGSGRMLYFGSVVKDAPSKGYVFIEFYGELGVLAFFT